MTKECSEYTRLAGSFCTITSSNIEEIELDAAQGRQVRDLGTQFDVKAHELLQRKHSERFVELMRQRKARAAAVSNALADGGDGFSSLST